MEALYFLFLVLVLIVVARIFFSMLPERVMPLACPSCHHDGGEDLVGNPRAWWRGRRDDLVYCRSCGRRYKEHPDGSLVEVRD
ncbi:MAG TPA: hypothetical protein VFQ53_28545 [Kofleriaceae bacterium]|nr:hypothetical protein [Kofleriaceae bacterium]